MALATSPRSFAAADDRPGERVLAVGLDAGGEAQHLGSSRPLAAATPVTTCSPLVSVPVLSNSTTSIVRIRSRASRSLTRMPLRADTAVDNEITSGIARPEGVRAGDHQHRDRAHDGVVDVAERRPHDERDRPGGHRHVEQQGGEAVGQGLGPAVAGLGVGDEPLDPGQRRVVTDGLDPDPDRRVRRHRAGDHPVAGPLATGLDSPVIIDSSSSASPSTIVPSAGTRPPARTSTTSPTPSSSIAPRRTSSPSTTSASSGSSSASAARAPRAWPIAFISCQ